MSTLGIPALPLMNVQDVKEFQPDTLMRVPLEIWGTTVSGEVDPAFDNPWLWSHELAESIRNGSATRAEAEQHIKNLLGSVEHILAAHPVLIPPKTEEVSTTRVNTPAVSQSIFDPSDDSHATGLATANPPVPSKTASSDVVGTLYVSAAAIEPPPSKVKAFTTCLINNLRSLIGRPSIGH